MRKLRFTSSSSMWDLFTLPEKNIENQRFSRFLTTFCHQQNNIFVRWKTRIECTLHVKQMIFVYIFWCCFIVRDFFRCYSYFSGFIFNMWISSKMWFIWRQMMWLHDKNRSHFLTCYLFYPISGATITCSIWFQQRRNKFLDERFLAKEKTIKMTGIETNTSEMP